MAEALAPRAARLERSFQAALRKNGYPEPHIRALLPVTPVAAARLGPLSRFLEQVNYSGRRLAKLNVSPAMVSEALASFDELLGPVFGDRFVPAREHLRLATEFVLRDAYYQVREAESQAFFALYQAELEATDLDDLLRRFVKVLAKAFDAAAGRLLFEEGSPSPELAHPLYIEHGQPSECLIGDRELRGRFASYWSYPFGPSAVLQLCFSTPYPWLPREKGMLAVAGARCREAIDRVRMAREIRQLEAASHCIEQEERRRIGRDLHDEVGQALAFLRLELEMLEREAPPQLRPRLGTSRDLAGRTATELRRVVAALSPSVLDRLGLDAAVRHLVERFRRVRETHVRLRGSVAAVSSVSKQVQEAVYHVAQECLQNIAKHTQATRVNLWLRAADKKIRLSVTDNGAGFCADKAWRKPNSFGLVGMRERAALLRGRFVVRSTPGKGTSVLLELPLGDAPVEANGKDSRTVN
ncbi:MAG: hypothetical protein C5B51_16225 [Terriglobia bacterium]|nr:MAG: hypothetical protein C5B51_16225 [Terriglobia bacterium]